MAFNSDGLEIDEYLVLYAIRRSDWLTLNQWKDAGCLALEKFPANDQCDFLVAAIQNEAEGLELMEFLLAAGCDPGAVNNSLAAGHEYTPLFRAAKAGRVNAMEMLAAAGADIHWASPSGANAASEIFPSAEGSSQDTPELKAAREWLAQRGVKMNANCQASWTKMWYAGDRPRSWPVIPMLLDLGVSAHALRWTPFMMKVGQGQATVADADQIPFEELAHHDSYGRTAFTLAVQAGRLDLARRLLERGSNLHQRGLCETTALHLAASEGHLELVEWLVERGIPVDAGSKYHDTPLYSAVEADHLEAARLLIRLGASPRKNFKGCSAIHAAYSLEMHRLLVEAGADVNDVSTYGDWPLNEACDRGQLDVVTFLLKSGAQVDLSTAIGTALFSAVRQDHVEIVRVLLEAGANPNSENFEGWTCLWSVQSLAVAEMLLNAGANPNHRDEMGDPPEAWDLLREIKALFREARLRQATPSAD